MANWTNILRLGIFKATSENHIRANETDKLESGLGDQGGVLGLLGEIVELHVREVVQRLPAMVVKLRQEIEVVLL